MRRLQQLLLAWDYFDLDERLTNEQGALQQELKAVPATFNDMQVSLQATPGCAAKAGSRQTSGACTGPLACMNSLHGGSISKGPDASPRTLSLPVCRL